MTDSHRGDDVHSIEAVMAMSIRDKIADVLDRERKWPDSLETADAILAALPELAAPLDPPR